MAKWGELTQEQKQQAVEVIKSLGIPLKQIPKMDFPVNKDN